MGGQRGGQGLSGLANAVIQPGFVGVRPPDWLRRRLAEGLGGVVLFARNIVDAAQVAALTAQLRAERSDLIVAIDEEAGDVTRLYAHTGSPWPGNFALGEIDDLVLTENVARQLGRELAGCGITFDYAPSADVNSDQNNPVIGTRSFGSEPSLVARHTAAWITGLQAAGVSACAKHFPGHGNTSVDSHLDLPVIKASRAELDAVELVPFRAAIDAGVQAIMSAHLRVPALDPQLPATLSRRIMTGLLREELGFTGLIVTDAIEMRAVADRYGLAHAGVLALAAGADAICVGGEHAGEATADELRDAIIAAVRSGELPEERLADAAARVGRLARWSAQAGTGGKEQADRALGLAAARRAITVSGRPVGLAEPAHVVLFQPQLNFAIAPETPWGVGPVLERLMPGTTCGTVTDGVDLPAALTASLGRPLVLVVRDLHRYPWMSDAVRAALAVRPDAIVVEMGVAVSVVGATHIATYGATSASAAAAAGLLAS
jgi:beta-N-acetylhexosaminidase